MFGEIKETFRKILKMFPKILKMFCEILQKNEQKIELRKHRKLSSVGNVILG